MELLLRDGDCLYVTAAAQVCGTLRQLVAESRQIGATGAVGYYGFTTNNEIKVYNVKGE